VRGSPLASTQTKKLPEVTIEAQRASLEHRVYKFVTAIIWRVDSHESLPRWNRPIRPLVAGLRREGGEFVLMELSQVATAVAQRSFRSSSTSCRRPRRE